MFRLGRLLTLTILLGEPVLSGCFTDSFALVGNVNVGGVLPRGESIAVGGEDDHPVDDANATTPRCIPIRTSAVTEEFAAHGYVTGKEPDWDDTRKWFGEIGKLPTCPISAP